MKDLKELEVKTSKELRNWLKKNHTQKESLWLVTYKRSSPFYLSHADLVDQLLCFGWIDGLARKRDDLKTMRLISPRKKASIWSKVNKDKIKRLESLGLIEASGWKAIEQAKSDGSWEFLDDVEARKIPEDFLKELKKYPMAHQYFLDFPPSAQKYMLYWIKAARQPMTREARIIEVAFLASENIRAR